MTDEEKRELDAWLAEHIFGWVWQREYKWDDFDRVKPYKRLVSPQQFDPECCERADGSEEYGWLGGALPEFYNVPPYTSPHADLLRSVKREIERRGWDWGVGYHRSRPRENRYDFMIYKDDKRLGHKYANSEEIAGCLAFKAAVEASDSVDCLNYCVYCGFLPDDSIICINGGHYSDCPILQIEKTGYPGCCCDSWEECICCCGKAASEMMGAKDVENTG